MPTVIPPPDTEPTRREREVAALVHLELGDKEIAARLGIAVPTVKAHVGRLMARLGVRSRIGVATWHQRQIDATQ